MQIGAYNAQVGSSLIVTVTHNNAALGIRGGISQLQLDRYILNNQRIIRFNDTVAALVIDY